MHPNIIQVTIDNQTLQVVDEYVYLGHNIRLEKNNQTAEINKRIEKTWAAFRKLAYILQEPKVPINLKRKDSCVVTIASYEMDTVTFSKKSANRICAKRR